MQIDGSINLKETEAQMPANKLITREEYKELIREQKTFEEWKKQIEKEKADFKKNEKKLIIILTMFWIFSVIIVLILFWN